MVINTRLALAAVAISLLPSAILAGPEPARATRTKAAGYSKTWCEGHRETTLYACRFKDQTWLLCMLDSGEVELRQIKAAKLVKRLSSTDSKPGVLKSIDDKRARLAFTLARDGVTYTVFDDSRHDDTTVSGLMIQAGETPATTLICPQKGPLAGLDEHHMPTVFSELLPPPSGDKF